MALLFTFTTPFFFNYSMHNHFLLFFYCSHMPAAHNRNAVSSYLDALCVRLRAISDSCLLLGQCGSRHIRRITACCTE